jgi:hypothetical protein
VLPYKSALEEGKMSTKQSTRNVRLRDHYVDDGNDDDYDDCDFLHPIIQ